MIIRDGTASEIFDETYDHADDVAVPRGKALATKRAEYAGPLRLGDVELLRYRRR